MTGNGPITAGPWTLRAHPRNAYHRVDGATYNVAIVKRREDAVAITLLPELADASIRLLAEAESVGLDHSPGAEQVRAALKKMQGDRT